MKNKIISFGMFALVFLSSICIVMAAICTSNGKEIPCDVFWANYGWIFVVLFLPFGLIALIKPEWLLKWEIWQQKIFMGAKFIPSKKTVIITRILGAIFAAFGLFSLYLTAFH
jgi:hypothetical protein